MAGTDRSVKNQYDYMFLVLPYHNAWQVHCYKSSAPNTQGWVNNLQWHVHVYFYVSVFKLGHVYVKER